MPVCRSVQQRQQWRAEEHDEERRQHAERQRRPNDLAGGRSASPGERDAYSIALLVSDLNELRRALELGTIVPLGYSSGAELAAEYALAHPAHVSRLILQAPTVDDGDAFACVQLDGFAAIASSGMRERIDAIVHGPGTAEEKLDRVWSAVDAATVDRSLFEDASLAELNRALWRESGLANSGDMARALRKRAGERPPLGERLSSVRCPTLVLVGRHDRNIGVEAGSRVADLIPNGRLHIFERSAHFPDIEEPEIYAELIRSFLQA